MKKSWLYPMSDSSKRLVIATTAFQSDLAVNWYQTLARNLWVKASQVAHALKNWALILKLKVPLFGCTIQPARDQMAKVWLKFRWRH